MDARRLTSTDIERTASFALAAAGTVAFSLLGGGGYDLVIRHEAGTLVWLVLAVGLAVGVLPLTVPARAGWALQLAVIALTGWTALALTWTPSAERTTVELGRIVFYAGVVAAVVTLAERRRARALLAGLFCGAVVVLALALLSRLFPSAFPTNYLALQGNVKRLAYPFGYWNAVGCLAAMVVGPALVIGACARPLAARALALASVSVAVPVAYLTYSRGTVGAIALTLVVVLVASPSRWVALAQGLLAAGVGAATIAVVRAHDGIALGTSTDGRWAVLAVVGLGAIVLAAAATLTGLLGLDRRLRLPTTVGRPAAIVAAVVVVAVAAVVGPGLAQRGWDSFSENRNTVTATDPTARLTNLNGQRLSLWRSALRAADAQPLHGIGPGTFEFWWDDDPRYDAYVRDAHNLYLETLGELGIVGAGLLAAVVLAALGGALLARRGLPDDGPAYAVAAATAAASWALFAAYDWMWESPAVTALMFAAAAAAISLGARGRGRRLPIAARVGGALGCLVAVAVLLPALSATSQVRGSEQAARRGDLDLALGRANDAVAAEPWASSPYLQRALVEELAGRLRAGAQDAQRAADREPVNYRTWLVLSRIQAERGQVRTALADYRRAKERKPAIAAPKPTSG
jgi:tetratricopeptide (TPR) repeat protein